MTAPIDLTEAQDGGILKEILKEGQGEAHPTESTTVEVNYRGTLTDGTEFDATNGFKFQLGVGQVIKAWDIGVASMKKGEKCRLTCAAPYAYGENGSPPKIPPNATLIFEVELLSWCYEDISPKQNQTIEKRVITKGEMYSTPKDLTEVTVHLRGTANNKVFDERDVVFVVGEGDLHDVPRGIEVAVQKMKKGEKAEIFLRGEYAKGPKIPEGSSEVSYIITLHNFNKPKEAWEMNADEKMVASEADKAKGTEHFKAGRLPQALKYYSRVREYLKGETSYEGEELLKKDELFVAAVSNMALVNLKLKKFEKCIENCTEVLEVDAKNVKVMFRRAQACVEINDFDDALVDLEKCIALEPENKAVLSLAQTAKSKRKAQTEKEKKMYQKMFQKLSEGPNGDEKRAPEEGVWTN